MIRENHSLKALIELHALVVELLVVKTRFGFYINELLIEESKIFERKDCVSLLVSFWMRHERV